MSISKTYIQYGVRSDWATEYEQKKLPATTFKNTSNKNLKELYRIPEEQVEIVKQCLTRQPIDDDLMETLLYNNRYTCCICRGQKSDAYIIHHIEEYSKSQNNEYYNLAVLCPNDHDLAHREGQMLTNKITPDKIVKAKSKWEKFVHEQDVERACLAGDISEVDFINVPRVLELYYEVFRTPPDTEFSEILLSAGAITNDGNIDSDFIKKHNKNPATPFIFFGPSGSWNLSSHYKEVFKKILEVVPFVDLDTLLTKKSIESTEIIGKRCYYVGGLYGNRPKIPITRDTLPSRLYFRRKDYWAEWMVDPTYMVSTTALHRLSDRKEYLVYGVIRSIDIKEYKSKRYIHIDIRPYLFGIPTKTKNRRPAIHYIDKYRDFEFEEEGDEELKD